MLLFSIVNELIEGWNYAAFYQIWSTAQFQLNRLSNSIAITPVVV